jgi:hypothetical protein
VETATDSQHGLTCRVADGAAPATYAGGMGTFTAWGTIALADRAVRDGHFAPVTCATCGCRLERREGQDDWWHFGGAAGRDARGCILSCTELRHTSAGTLILSTPLD